MYDNKWNETIITSFLVPQEMFTDILQNNFQSFSLEIKKAVNLSSSIQP